MAASEKAKAYNKKMFPYRETLFKQTDPEFIERFDNFAFDDVISTIDLDDISRFHAIIASLIGVGGVDEYRMMIAAAMRFGVSPAEIKEIAYQSVAYIGIGRAYPFLHATNEVFVENGIEMPLASAQTTTDENRREKGEQAQIEIFGEQMRGYAESGDKDTVHIRRWLAENCFGDYYTRKVLDYKKREMITFCFLAAQGGCEPQLISHIKANLRLGNDREYLIKIASQILPYIGYPRALNALACIEETTVKQR